MELVLADEAAGILTGRARFFTEAWGERSQMDRQQRAIEDSPEK